MPQSVAGTPGVQAKRSADERTRRNAVSLTPQRMVLPFCVWLRGQNGSAWTQRRDYKRDRADADAGELGNLRHAEAPCLTCLRGEIRRRLLQDQLLLLQPTHLTPQVADLSPLRDRHAIPLATLDRRRASARPLLHPELIE